MTNFCMKCNHQDHESNLLYQLGGGFLCRPCHKKNQVDHPSHYQGNNFEVIDIIEDFELNFNLGNVIKYILRSDKKLNRMEDLKKAYWYLGREIGESFPGGLEAKCEE